MLLPTGILMALEFLKLTIPSLLIFTRSIPLVDICNSSGFVVLSCLVAII